MNPRKALTSLLLALTATLAASENTDVSRLVSAAKRGETVTLPEGVYAIGEAVTVPDGVSIRGESYDKTVVNVKGPVGFIFKNSRGVSISNLTVQGATTADIQLDDAQDVTISRVRVLRAQTGIFATRGQKIQIENCVAAACRTGIAFNGSAQSAVVNCTISGNSALGLSFNQTTGCAGFNDLFVTNAIGVFIAQNNTTLALDHNVYFGALIGKGKDNPMPSLSSWRDMEQQDHHSVALPVNFADAANFNFKPTNACSWSPDRAITAGWGVAKFGAFSAPTADIDGQSRATGFCAGAWEAPFTAPHAADGTFTIENVDGYASAGLFDETDRQVTWLFNMLPLAKGSHPYWLPTCDWQGRAIPPGKYTLRISEADLSLKFLAMAGDTGASFHSSDVASTGIEQVVYDSKDHPVLCLNWSESYRQYRAMDDDLQHERWMMPGCNFSLGACSDGAGKLYTLRDNDKESVVLSRLDEETGRYDEVQPNDYGFYLKKDVVGAVRGVAVLDGVAYLASCDKGKLLAGPKFESGFDVAKPSSPCADRKRKLLWVLSNGTDVLALDASGAVKHKFTPNIPGLASLSVNGDRMALLSVVAGKVSLFDLSDADAPKFLRTIGTGDGPEGPIQPDRFLFQGMAPLSEQAWFACKVSLSAQGVVAVADSNGVKLFNWDGSARRDFSGVWGQAIEVGAYKPGEPIELIDQRSWRTMLLDEQTHATKFGAQYGLPTITGFKRGWYAGGMFLRDGKRFGLIFGQRSSVDAAGKPKYNGTLVVMRYDNCKGVPILALSAGADSKLATFDDFSADFSDLKNWKPATDAAGASVNYFLNDFEIVHANGDIQMGTTILPLKGLDAQNKPLYDFSAIHTVKLHPDSPAKTILSPYDYTTLEPFPGGVHHMEYFPDQTSMSTVFLRKTGHSGNLCNWSGTEIAGYDKDGGLRWLQPMAALKDVEGTKLVDDLSYSVSMALSEIQILDKNGMYLGAPGAPRELFWHGMCLDNTHQFLAFKGATGKHYVCFGNFNDCCVWWMEVQGRDSIRYQTIPVAIDAAKAADLTKLPRPVIFQKPSNTATQVTIAKLSEPMKIDGDLEKWRKILPVPQILITPETSSEVSSPADASAVIRLAHEGGNLYVQCLRFDDVVTMSQPLPRFFKQDTLEMAINSFTAGIKLNVTHTRDHGDVVFRDGWFLKGKELALERAPRSIRVLDNARDVEERKLIEQCYGVDLSACKVIVTEFKIPLDDETFEGRLPAKPAGTSGTSMRLGFCVDDSDVPGADIQKCLVWPASYGTFSDPTFSATVLFE